MNIVLHAAAASMAGLILYRLAIPGAYFAAAIFALHPVQVETAAWITEIKNTLSAVFYLGAAIAWLRYKEKAKAVAYALSLGLFVLALCSKTVTATPPAALLVIEWWQHERLSWRRDFLPLVGRRSGGCPLYGSNAASWGRRVRRSISLRSSAD